MLDMNHANDDSVSCYNDEYHCFIQPENPLLLATYHSLIYRPISRVVIGREVDYRSRLIYVRYCLTNTTLCL